MDFPILIGIHGVKRAGKGTVARFVKEWAAERSPALTALDRGFADKAKLAFARQFFPTIQLVDAVKWVDEFKDEPGAKIVFPDPDADELSYLDLHFRQCMAQFATEGARDIYGDNHWVDQLLPMGTVDPIWNWEMWHHEFSYKMDENAADVADFCTVSDLRFENEVQRIKELGGLCWKVRRKDAEEAVIAEAAMQGREIHRSELGLSDDLFDTVFINDDNDMHNACARVYTELDKIVG